MGRLSSVIGGGLHGFFLLSILLQEPSPSPYYAFDIHRSLHQLLYLQTCLLTASASK
jgi:hypothetical protein